MQTVFLAGAVLLATLPGPVRAVVFVSTADPDHNTTRPTGDLAGSGWDLQGVWRGFSGTPIAPNLFLTAKHVGGSVGESFVLGDRTYPTLAAFPDGSSDLIIWQVCGEFGQYADLYPGTEERGQRCVVHGRGLGRGAAVYLGQEPNRVLKGWEWAPGSAQLRWGVNTVAAITNLGGSVGSVLELNFDADGGAEEACLTGGDSGGGLFMLAEGVWTLAGINLAVDGPFNFTATSPGFNAALLDRGGLYQQERDGSWRLVPDGPADRPSVCYVTRLSARRDWVSGIIAQHGSRPSPPRVESSPTAQGPFEGLAEATVDPVGQTIVLPLPASNRFYRLDYCRPLRIVQVRPDAAQLVLDYE